MGARLARLRSRVVQLAAAAFLLGLVFLIVAGSTTYVAVHQTAQPDFCNSCHIMEPYFESWKHSSHSNISCIECHYEPGAVETFEGKFEALSQLAKYATRTQGTKPWAEVSDASCMRSGCHSVRMLEGDVQFGRVSFDHRPHLLEARSGRQLRCVTCHSQIVQDEHISVTESVCFMCHFMPHTGSDLPPATSDCNACHGSPTEDVLVNGRPFSHEDYVARGVDCRECHSHVVEGDGTVRPERCQSCHSEVENIARIGEAVFLHEKHITDNKVECFECHDEIRHGLLPLKSHDPVPGQGCVSCHSEPHGAASLLYAGQGAIGVPDAPSRMYETRVVCEACHTGRTEASLAALAPSAGFPGGVGKGYASARKDWEAAHGRARLSGVAAAGNLDCVHCHGPDFDGMLAGWQDVVGGQLDRIEPFLTTLEEHLPADDGHPALELYREARTNVELVARDGSRGAHNPTYAVDALRAGAERIERAFELLGVEPAAPVVEGFPFVSKDGCQACHLGVEDTPVEVHGRPFPHDRHVLAAGLECSACHSTEHHGEPAFPRSDCASCHHRESPDRDPADCGACHGVQDSLLRGTLPELADQHAVMGEMECSECHGDPPDVLRPSPQLCVLCHEEGYDRMQVRWQQTVGAQVDRLLPRLAELERDAGTGAAGARELLGTARAEIELVLHDGSRGAHNPHGALSVLRGAAGRMDSAAGLLGAETDAPATSGFPFRSAQDCTTCHLGIDGPAAEEGGFPHGPHLRTGSLDCNACHSVETHGEPAVDRLDCTSCHHRETPEIDPFECGACHADQSAFVAGVVAGLVDQPAPMAAKECTDCHGEPPGVVRPSPSLCVLCHEEGYDALPASWRARTDDLAGRLRSALAEAGAGVDPARVARARSALAAVEGDGSHGAHNPELAEFLLRDALEAVGGR